MKKQASGPFLVWVTVILLQAHLIIAAVSKSNDTISVCDGSVEDCLNVHDLDSQLPTISSSHFRRILAEGNKGVTKDTPDSNSPAIKCKLIEAYKSCLPPSDGSKRKCGTYNKGC